MAWHISTKPKSRSSNSKSRMRAERATVTDERMLPCYTPQQLTLICHAQGFHNLNIEGRQFRDPQLTLDGQQQCHDLAWKLGDVYSIDCIVASPLRRTLHTALLVFEELLQFKPDLCIIALPELQETSDLPCDIGSPVEELEKEFRGKPVDLSLIPHDWTDKVTGIFTPQR